MKNTKKIKILYGFFLPISILIISGCTGQEGSQVVSKGLAEDALAVVQAGLMDPDPRVRTNAIEAAATTGRKDLMPKVAQMLTNEFIPVRFAAALAMGDTGYSPAKNTLNQMLKVSDENTALAVCFALYKLGDKSKLSVIEKALENKDMSIRANAALLLGKTGDKNAIKNLWQAIDAKDSDDKVRFQAAEALAMLGDENIYPKIWTMMLNINADVKLLGVLAMGAVGTEQARGALTTELSDQILEVRLAAAGQLGKLGYTTGEPEVLDVFVNNLTSKMDPVAAERVLSLAALAIGQIKTPSLAKYLPILLKNESKFVRLAAAKAVLLNQ
jgi:HEAT repeat protein